ncbi:MAG: acyl-CoA/acyl-ACP dehydrogenase [Thermoplasmata archaeon]|nr:acyl-CoA/acyl-ACP dehydrogenase [Thermoplasmata archaeon]
MDYNFTEEQELFRESMREFCTKEIAPRSEKLEGLHEMPAEIVKTLANFELLGMPVDPDYGGLEADAVTMGIAVEELARADPNCSIPVFFLVENSWSHVLNKYGTDQAKQEILPKVVSGERFLGIASTESDVGSDLGSMKTKIRKSENGYVVNGEKMYISGISEALAFGGGHVTLARMTEDLGTRGMNLFYLPLDASGISTTLIGEMGRDGISFGGFNIDNVEIPAHYLIGEENKGFYIIHEGYELARGLIGLVCAGTALKSLENGMAYIKERKAFGKPIGKYEGIQFKLAEHYVKMQALRDLSYKALWTYDQEAQGKASRFDVSMAMAMAKSVASEWAFAAINDVMQWQGAFGYSTECPDQKALRGVRSFSLAEGSAEIMKLIIARELLGKEFLAYR